MILEQIKELIDGIQPDLKLKEKLNVNYSDSNISLTFKKTDKTLDSFNIKQPQDSVAEEVKVSYLQQETPGDEEPEWQLEGRTTCGSPQ